MGQRKGPAKVGRGHRFWAEVIGSGALASSHMGAPTPKWACFVLMFPWCGKYCSTFSTELKPWAQKYNWPVEERNWVGMSTSNLLSLHIQDEYVWSFLKLVKVFLTEPVPHSSVYWTKKQASVLVLWVLECSANQHTSQHDGVLLL